MTQPPKWGIMNMRQFKHWEGSNVKKGCQLQSDLKKKENRGSGTLECYQVRPGGGSLVRQGIYYRKPKRRRRWRGTFITTSQSAQSSKRTALSSYGVSDPSRSIVDLRSVQDDLWQNITAVLTVVHCSLLLVPCKQNRRMWIGRFL